MRQYTNESQTAKLIELGFDKPRTVVERKDYGVFFPIEEVRHYSIGELIEMLPRIVEYKGFYYGLQITTDCTYCWDVRYEPNPYEKGKPKLLPIHDSGSCLIDKLYEVLLQLIEMKDEFTDAAGHKEYNGKEVISKVFKLKEEGEI